MRAKKLDKLATAVLYTIASIIVTILASLILYILVRGLPHISWSFLTGKVFCFSSRWWDWHSALQFLFPIGHYLDYFCTSFYGSWDLLG
ncbi:phosphate permease PstA [Streptococcus pneumoniae]|nr:phosphate permease PstA [Streptococcus pneumoniae]